MGIFGHGRHYMVIVWRIKGEGFIRPMQINHPSWQEGYPIPDVYKRQVLLKQYHRNIAAVLLDLVMPQKDGYQVLAEMNDMHLLPECPVIIITSEDSPDNTVKAFDLGASDIVMKPFDPVIVKRRVENSIALSRNQQNLQERIDEQAARLMESNAVMIDALSAIIEYRSVETGQHIQRIRMFTRIDVYKRQGREIEGNKTLTDDLVQRIVDAANQYKTSI